ncbi:unnamed protein product [Microthlaspi erraticum]|uniref:Uncharacterized protein n=1 Tax=Microthlaspi erraticum TaxID=1685480 RepID=A0A6D2HZM3_9BRAS|nr:unnamed protein product [Microthlaspi erraticum]
MNYPQVETDINARRFPPMLGHTENSVLINVLAKYDEILLNPTTGHQTLTGRSSTVYIETIDFCLRSSSPRDIEQLLRDRLVDYHWICEGLASEISTAATDQGFGLNEFTLTIFVTITLQPHVVLSDPSASNDNEAEALLRMVLLARIKREDLKSLKLETESCSICLDNLSDFSKHGDPTPHGLFPCLSQSLSLEVASPQKYLPHVSDCSVRIRSIICEQIRLKLGFHLLF